MPNHITNTLEITVWHSDNDDYIRKVLDLITTDDPELPYIDFNAIIPPPEDMFTGNLSIEDRQYCAEAGIPNWYDWQIQNWGTKWNAYSQEILENSHDCLKLQFDTAWAPPEPVIARLRSLLEEKFPASEGYEVYVNGFWVEEGYQSAGVF